MKEDNAMCLNARDYKGICDQGINGVAVYGAQLQGYTIGNNIDNAYTLAARDSKGLRFSDNQPDNIAVYPVKVSTTEVVPLSEDAVASKVLARDYKGVDTYGINGAGVKIPIRENVKKGYSEATYGDGINLTAAGYETRRGRIGKGVAQTLDTGCNQGVLVNVDEDTQVYAVWHERSQSYIAIRKLTPRECFRLQGWTDEYFEKAAFVNSDTQLYKEAGNGITVNVVHTIAEMIKVKEIQEEES